MPPSRIMVDVFLGVCLVLVLGNFAAPWMGLERMDQLSWLPGALAGLLLGVRPGISRRSTRRETDKEDDPQ